MKRRPRYMTPDLADKLKKVHSSLIDPDASRVWGLIEFYRKWKGQTMPLQDHEGILIARVLS